MIRYDERLILVKAAQADVLQWDSNSLWESRYIWLPVNIDDDKKTLEVEWHDVYDLNVYVPTPGSYPRTLLTTG